MNLWKQVSADDNPPVYLNMVVEVLSGSRGKYEY